MTRQTTIAAVCLAAAATFGVVTWGQPQFETPPRITDMGVAQVPYGTDEQQFAVRIWSDGLAEYRGLGGIGPLQWTPLPENLSSPQAVPIAVSGSYTGGLVGLARTRFARQWSDGTTDTIIIEALFEDGVWVPSASDWSNLPD